MDIKRDIKITRLSQFIDFHPDLVFDNYPNQFQKHAAEDLDNIERELAALKSRLAALEQFVTYVNQELDEFSISVIRKSACRLLEEK